MQDISQQAFSLIYSVIAFAALLNKNILPEELGPQSIPYTNVPRRYDIQLEFDTEYGRSNKVVDNRLSVCPCIRFRRSRWTISKSCTTCEWNKSNARYHRVSRNNGMLMIAARCTPCNR